jgi:hypothetical protein
VSVQSEPVRVDPDDSPLGAGTNEMCPVLQRRKQCTQSPHVDAMRRELLLAAQRGALSQEELAVTLHRLEHLRTNAS